MVHHRIDETIIEAGKEDLPDLIAKYGDASSTSWVEGRYRIWRSEKNHLPERPMVQGYLHSGRFNFAWGNPLCHKDDLKKTVQEFVEWSKSHHKHPVFACVSHEVEEILGEGFGGKKKWKTLSCIKEDNLHPDDVDLMKKDIRGNRLKAMHSKVIVDEIYAKGPTFLPPDDIKKQIEDGLERWKSARQGTQIASSALLPWIDSTHRRYFIAKVPGSGIVGVTILTPIASGYQIKNSIVFPEAPRGTSEDLLGTVIEQMQDEGVLSLTFGASAAEEFSPEHNFNANGWRVNFLTKVYRHIVKKHHLAERGQFRHKFGTEDDPLYIAYEDGGLGLEGVTALMHALRTK